MVRSTLHRGVLALFMCSGSFALASAAPTTVPDPSHCVLQSAFLDVEGSTNGQPDNCSDGRCGDFTITIRDFANNIIPGSNVVIDFSGCSDIQISCDQLTAVTGQTYVSPKKVAGTTNAIGQFTFKVQGSANAVPTAGITTSPGTNAGVPCAAVYADGVLLGNLMVVAYDINGIGSPAGAVNAADVSLVCQENAKVSVGAQARERDDYNHSGTLTSADVAISASMATQAGVGTGSRVTGPFCSSLVASGTPAATLSSQAWSPIQTEAIISIDARNLADKSFLVDNGTCVCYDATVIQSISLTNTTHHLVPCLSGGSCLAQDIPFLVHSNGTVTFDPSLSPGVTGNNTGTLVVNSYPFPPADDDVEQSMGQFAVIVEPRFWSILAGYPGFGLVNGVHRLVSPPLYEPATTIGRSDLLLEGDANDLAGVPVGTAGTLVSDASFGFVPPGFSGPANTPELHTEVASLNMQAFNGSGVAVRAGTAAPDRPISPGEIQPMTSTAFFPAKSFFNVNADVDLPVFGGNPGLTTLHNSAPLVVAGNNLLCFPPVVVYTHSGATPPVPLLFNADDTQPTKRWLAGQRLGWLVLGGHGFQFDVSNSGTNGLPAFQQFMSGQAELADSSTEIVDILDVCAFTSPSAFVSAAYRDSLCNGIDGVATKAGAGNPCGALHDLVLGLLVHLDGLGLPTDNAGSPREWVQDSTTRAVLYTKLLALATQYQTRANTTGGCLPVAVGPGTASGSASIEYVRPNPSRGSSTIGFSLAKRGTIDLAIYDLGGRLVRTLVRGELAAGEHSVTWNGNNGANSVAPSGIYFARLLTEGTADVKRVMIIR